MGQSQGGVDVNVVQRIQSTIGHGIVVFEQGWRGGYQTIRVHGGPYNDFPEFMGDKAYGVCVREERTKGLKIDAHVPIKDFHVPTPEQEELVVNVIKRIIDASLDGKLVYVGCMGGFGRTGLFLAVLAKALGKDDPVGYVRKHYVGHAVETPEQKDYVNNFDVTALKSYLFWAGWKRYLRQLLWR
jgi:hypothetical protein